MWSSISGNIPCPFFQEGNFNFKEIDHSTFHCLLLPDNFQTINHIENVDNLKEKAKQKSSTLEPQSTSDATHPAPEGKGFISEHSYNPSTASKQRQEGCPIQSITNDRFPKLRSSFTFVIRQCFCINHLSSQPKEVIAVTFRDWDPYPRLGIWFRSKTVTAQSWGKTHMRKTNYVFKWFYLYF